MHKINRFSIYSILVLALFIHLTVLKRLSILGAKPDLLLVLVVFVGLFSGEARGLEAGLVSGFLEDLFALDMFGINALVLGTTGFLAGILNTKFFKDSRPMQFSLTLSCTIFSMMLHFVLARFILGSFGLKLSDYFINSVIPAAIYTGLVSIPTFSRLIDIYKLKEDEELL